MPADPLTPKIPRRKRRGKKKTLQFRNVKERIVIDDHPVVRAYYRTMQQRGMTARNIQLKGGIRCALFYRFIRGQVSPTLDTLTKLCDALDLNIVLVDKPGSYWDLERKRLRNEARKAGLDPGIY